MGIEGVLRRVSEFELAGFRRNPGKFYSGLATLSPQLSVLQELSQRLQQSAVFRPYPRTRLVWCGSVAGRCRAIPARAGGGMRESRRVSGRIGFREDRFKPGWPEALVA